MTLGFYSYVGAAIAYGLFAFLLIFSWRESLHGKLLFMVMLVSTCWSLLSIKIALQQEAFLFAYQLFEIVRYIVWYVFLLKLFDTALADSDQSFTLKIKSSYQRFVRWALPVAVGFAVMLLLNVALAEIYSLSGQYVFGIAGNVILALVGLAITEQLFRNTSTRHRWAIKYLFLGIGGIFAFDFYLYADALLFQSFNQDLWGVRGLVHFVAVPLLVISSARNKNWSLNIFVSRDIVLNTTVILGGGFYLLAMAGAGYYLREYGGNWGEVGQVMLIILAVVFLFAILSSAKLRAQARVFLGKHFYKNKYDYRAEWLRLTEDLNSTAQVRHHYQTAIEAMAHIVDARGGWLWLRDETGTYKNVDVWQIKSSDKMVAGDSSLVNFLTEKRFVINLSKIEDSADEYADLRLPEWLAKADESWLIVPLHGDNVLLGFVVLANPLVERSINWEDRDLLKTAAKQIASFLTVVMTSAELAEAKQFEVFTRLSAYMVHDLKNIAAELELVALNAKKHTGNPEFIKDAFETVENAAGDINRLLEQLRSRRTQDEKKVMVDLVDLVADVISSKQHQQPVPQLRVLHESDLVPLEKGRLSNVLAHLIDNAQQASEDNGEVILTLSVTENMCTIEIRDNGHGMDEGFISKRLFKPFDTTKGNAGMGIGMYESREFIRQLGGDIYVQSKPEKGSIITLYIPLSSAGGG
ncbi:MAG: PEP-CTERM system histidine kinase PrsK [Gammaproteobacteria bacterium]|nr:PEP-CTERM system histidine kinase PrsK [Gammaproteobacteria bacterium]